MLIMKCLNCGNEDGFNYDHSGVGLSCEKCGSTSIGDIESVDLVKDYFHGILIIIRAFIVLPILLVCFPLLIKDKYPKLDDFIFRLIFGRED